MGAGSKNRVGVEIGVSVGVPVNAPVGVGVRVDVFVGVSVGVGVSIGVGVGPGGVTVTTGSRVGSPGQEKYGLQTKPSTPELLRT